MKNLQKLISLVTNLKPLTSILISIGISIAFILCATLIDYSNYIRDDSSCERIRLGSHPKELNCEKIIEDFTNKKGDKGNDTTNIASKYDMEEIWKEDLNKDFQTCNAIKHGDTQSALDSYRCDFKAVNFINFVNWEKMAKGIAVISFGLFMLMSLVRIYSKELSIGWRRLSITLSVTISMIAPLFFRDEYDYGLPIILIIFLPIFLIVLLAKKIYVWIRAGFDQDISRFTSLESSEDEYKGDSPDKEASEFKKTFSSKADINISKLNSATFWTRFFARSIDLAFIFGLSIYTIYLLAQIPNFGNDSHTFSFIVAAIVLNTVSFLYEYVCLILFEASLGKVMFNLIVVTINCKPLNNSECLNRAWKVTKNCFGFFMIFPILQIYLTLKAKNALQKNQSTSYDKNTYLVKQKPISLLRWISCAGLAFILLALAMLIVEILK